MKYLKPFKDILLVFLVLILSTVFGYALSMLGVRDENILMFYIISAIILVIELTKVYWGFLFAFLCTLTYNFFFVPPYYSFHIYDQNSWITIAIFFVVTILISILVTQIKKQMQMTKETEEQLRAIFEISEGYLKQVSPESIVYYAMKSIYKAKGQKSVVYLVQSNQLLSNPYYIQANFSKKVQPDPIAKWCYLNSTPCGYGTSFYETSKWKYIPIQIMKKTIGVLGVDCHEKDFDVENDLFNHTVLSQMALSLEKAQMFTERSQNQEQKLKSEAYQELLMYLNLQVLPYLKDLEKRKQMQDKDLIKTWLNLDNSLKSLSTVLAYNADLYTMHKKEGSIKDLLKKVVDLYSDIDSKNIFLDGQSSPMFSFDSYLMNLMFCTLMDNFIKYTFDNSSCFIQITSNDQEIMISVKDDGPGYPKNILDKFSSLQELESIDAISGLHLCWIVVRLHNGKMILESNNGAQATFVFPVKKQQKRTMLIQG